MRFKPATSRLTAIAITAMLAITSVASATEDGTGGSLPESLHQCEIVAAQWTASEESPEASPVASPIASPVASPIASPVASPIASPVASPVVSTISATPVAEEDALTDDLVAASHSILDCMSDNNLEILLQVTGTEFRGSWLGFGSSISDDDFSVLLPMMPNLPYALVNVENALAEGNTATATVTYTAGRQLITREWTYELMSEDGQDYWQAKSETVVPTEIPTDAATIQIVINDGSFELNTTTVSSGNIVFDVTNVGEAPHEVLLVRAPAGTNAGDFAAAPNGLPAGSTFVGQVTVPAGTQGKIVLLDVRPGTYMIVDLLPGESGLPNVSDGMFVEFSVD